MLWGGAAVLPLGLALGWMLTTSWAPIRRLVALVTEQIGPALAASSAAELALLALAAGTSEEVLFRGVVHYASRAYAPVAASWERIWEPFARRPRV